ncbi:type 1 fimbrial protein [Enterobacter soli]|uniref:type 1 fimbrial protein n=1 Tax=Enterobacter soli TaxID=885040 RepID=UPI0034CE87A4
MQFIYLTAAILFMLSFSSRADCNRDRNDSVSVSTISLPDHILINSGSYAKGTVLYDSGFVAGSDNSVTIKDCYQTYYVGFIYLSAPQTGSTLGDNIYPTSLEGVGVRVYALNQAGPYDGARAIDNSWQVGDGGILYSSHTLNNSSYKLQLVATGGAISSGALTLPSPLARVDFRENKTMTSSGDIASSLSVSSSQVNVRAMGCIADRASLNFDMSDINVARFDAASRVGGVTQSLNLACEPGTNVALTVQAPPVADGDNQNNTLIALSQDGASGAADGVGVQLNLRLASGSYDSGQNGLPLNAPLAILSSQRVVNGSEGYTAFSDAGNPGGAQASETLTFTADYYKNKATVTPGRANAAGTLTFIYN